MFLTSEMCFKLDYAGVCNEMYTSCVLNFTPVVTVLPKEIKYNLHCDDVWGDFLWPPHSTKPATVE